MDLIYFVNTYDGFPCSCRAMVGRVAPQPWLHVQWLMSEFGNSPQETIAAYVNHVRGGVDLPSVWEQLQGQLYLGGANFAEVLGEKMGNKLSADAGIPRLQRRTSAPWLARFAAMPERNMAIGQSLRNSCYSMKEMAQDH